jgi:predicted dithiol-disulfide oxidoreductase (DUF899 family)
MTTHAIVSEQEWIEARKALLAEEKALTRERDRLAEKRRALPWLRVEKNYVFEGEDGPVTLAELFDGRSQLGIYHFMFAPDWEQGCVGCSFLADQVDGARQHFEHNDLSFAAVSRAPIEKLKSYRERMGWRFRWVSSAENDFNFDFHVSFREEDKGRDVLYNHEYMPYPGISELPGATVFFRDDDGTIYQTYTSFARGGEEALTAYVWLDMTPKGRNETGNGNLGDWVRRHDDYPAA